MSLEEQIAQSRQISFISQAERRNARFQKYMEDTHTVIPCLDGNPDRFYASVFDGHGGSGCSGV